MWLRAGTAAAVAALMLTSREPLHAQVAFKPTLGDWPTTTMPQPRREARPIPPPPDLDTLPVAPIRRLDPDTDTAEGITERAGNGTARPTPDETTLPQDGILATAEPESPIDGLDAASRETRTSEDRAAFAADDPGAPAVGYDALAFAIEPEPLSDRRPTRFAALDPYEPTGIRLGSFLIYPEAEIGGAAFGNVLRSATDDRSDVAFEARPAIRAVSNWAVHALEFGAKATTSFHNQLPSEDDRAYALDLRGRLDVTRRTNAQGFLTHDVTQESRGTINSRAGANGRGDVTTDRAGVVLNHRFNRLAVQLRGAVTERDYDPSPDGTGITISNDDRNVTQREAAVRASWTFKPELTLFGEIGHDTRDYDAPGRSDGIRRDSQGERYRAGVSFGTTGQIVRGEAAIGAARQAFDDGRLPTVNGIIIDANLAWRVTGLTSVLLTANTDVGEATVAGSGGSINRQAGLEVRHAFRRNLIGSVGTRLSRADYEGVNLAEQETQVFAGVEHFLSRNVTLFGRYTHFDFSSTAPQSDYTGDELRFGVRIRR